MTRPIILGIVNITEDSFSDGGNYLRPEEALRHALRLHEEGAGVVDLGAASSNPSAAPVSSETELVRLQGVLPALRERGIPVSVDSFQPEVQKYAMEAGAEYLNDIQAFPHEELYPLLARASCKLILMHSIQRQGIATKEQGNPDRILHEVREFFRRRVEALTTAGISSSRLILDPGMGFFLGADPDSSFRILAEIRRLKEEFQLPLLISVSRKSFLGEVTGREVARRGAATLAAELWAVEQGADYIRTHDAAALRDALLVRERLESMKK